MSYVSFSPWLQVEVHGESLKLLFVWVAIQQRKGSRQSYWKVCLKNETPGGSLPLLPQPMERLACLIQRHPRPGHFSIQGKRMHKLRLATATDAARDVWEKGRNDRNYDKAALFREKGLNTRRRLCMVECGNMGERVVSRRRAAHSFCSKTMAFLK